MPTVTFAIKPYLASYMYVRYILCVEGKAIHLSNFTILYHCLHRLTVPHPQGVSWKETGNITLVLPSPRIGKNPEVFNYIGHDSVLILEKKIEVEMKAELYEFLLENKFCNGVMYKQSMETFVDKYNMVEQVSEESLMRAFQRWRKVSKERFI